MTPRKRKLHKQARINKQLKKSFNLYFSICYYCNKAFLIDDLTIEHIKPLSFGGTSDIDNIELACAPCNRQKGKEAFRLKRTINREKYAHLRK